MRVLCRTNLDLHPSESFPKNLPSVPRVGDFVESKRKWESGFILRLAVCAVTWRLDRAFEEFRDNQDEEFWFPEIELNLSGESVLEFQKRYKRCQENR